MNPPQTSITEPLLCARRCAEHFLISSRETLTVTQWGGNRDETQADTGEMWQSREPLWLANGGRRPGTPVFTVGNPSEQLLNILHLLSAHWTKLPLSSPALEGWFLLPAILLALPTCLGHTHILQDPSQVSPPLRSLS